MIGGWEAKDKRTRLEGFQKGEGGGEGGGARGEGCFAGFRVVVRRCVAMAWDDGMWIGWMVDGGWWMVGER
jgi:hypothetical protein